MNYISTSMLINEMNINEIYKLEKNPVNEGNAVIYNGSKNILFRQLISAVLAQLFNFKIIGYFFTTYFFKAILMSKLFLSFYFLLNQIQIKHKYTLSLIFTLVSGHYLFLKLMHYLNWVHQHYLFQEFRS